MSGGLLILKSSTWTAPHDANFVSSVRRESNSGAYFAGMFRVANVEFIPEYRQEESQEFVSMANKIQHVVRIDATVFTTQHQT